ncbi:hypothetical protein OH77DRAFT_1509222 [Trametes cingulata]|nr:hypothetical protein OH77DRAFT_1509222 [Trametes cingulata]
MTSAPVLPPELCDHILDFLSDDKPTLRACALTARDWLPRAQHHLFRSIYLDWSNCYAFSRLLAAAPALAAHVATLEIEGAFGIFSMDRLHGATLDAWLRAVPAWLPPRLTHLTKLELALLTIDADLVRRFFGVLRGVEHLTLWACALTTFDVFVDLFRSFPRLRRLTVAFTQEWEANPCAGAPWSQADASPQLEEIELTSSCDNFKVLRWLVAQDLHRSVHTLSCTRVPWAGLCALGEVLDAFAGTLQNLRIGLGDSMTATDLPNGGDWACPRFSALLALRTLTLDIHTARLSAVPYTLYLLAQLAAPALRTLVFAVRCGEFDTAFLIPWDRIAEVAARFAKAGGAEGQGAEGGEGAREGEGQGLQRVMVSVRERESADPELVRVDARKGFAQVDVAEMERSVRAAFGAQDMGGIVEFERLDPNRLVLAYSTTGNEGSLAPTMQQQLTAVTRTPYKSNFGLQSRHSNPYNTSSQANSQKYPASPCASSPVPWYHLKNGLGASRVRSISGIESSLPCSTWTRSRDTLGAPRNACMPAFRPSSWSSNMTVVSRWIATTIPGESGYPHQVRVGVQYTGRMVKQDRPIFRDVR